MGMTKKMVEMVVVIFLYICVLGTSNQLQKLFLIIMLMKHLLILTCRQYIPVLRLSEDSLVLINSESWKF